MNTSFDPHAEPLDEKQLNYPYEGVEGQSLRAVPTMANVLAYPGFSAREPDTGTHVHA